MISKKQFVKAIEFVLEQEEREHQFQKALQSYTGDKDFTGWHTSLMKQIVTWLEDEMGDIDHTISWWLWDAPEAGKDPDSCVIEYPTTGERWNILTIADLYDYLVETNDEGTESYFEYGADAQREVVKLALNEIDKLITQNTETNSNDDKLYEYNALLKLVRNRVEKQYRMTADDFMTNLEKDHCKNYMIFRRNDEV